MKRCNKCNQPKNESEFHKNKATKDGLYTICKQCRKEYYKNNKKKKIEYQKEYNKNNKKKINEQRKKYKQNHKQEIKKYNKEYYQNHKGEHCERSVRYYAKKLNATPSYANLDKIRLFYLTAELLTELYNEEYQVDHIIPLQGKRVSGLHHEDNLQVISATDNIKKNNKFIPTICSLKVHRV